MSGLVRVLADDRERGSGVLAVLAASGGDLVAVEGIGPRLATRVRWALSEVAAPYVVGEDAVVQTMTDTCLDK